MPAAVYQRPSPLLSIAAPIVGNRVLVVADECCYSEQLPELLSGLGCELVGPVSTAQRALACYRAAPVDLILLDMGLRSSLDGVQLAELLLAHAPVPLIFVIPFIDEVTFRRAQAVGPAAYLLKPIDAEALKRAMALAVASFSPWDWVAAPASPVAVLPDVIYVYVRESELLEKVRLADIHYLQAHNEVCTIGLAERCLTVHMPLRQLAGCLPAKSFIQIQQSHFINPTHIERLDPARYLVQLGKQMFPVGRQYLPGLLRCLHAIT